MHPPASITPFVALSADQSAPVMMMIAFITLKSSLVPLIEGLCAQIYVDVRVMCMDDPIVWMVDSMGIQIQRTKRTKTDACISNPFFRMRESLKHH